MISLTDASRLSTSLYVGHIFTVNVTSRAASIQQREAHPLHFFYPN